MKTGHMCFALAFLLFWCGAVASEPFFSNDEKLHRLSRDDFDKMARKFLPDAQAGDARAQYELGKLGFAQDGLEGLTVPVQEIVGWVSKSAEQGYTDAEVLLGTIYFSDEYAGKDDQQALKWFRRAAVKGHARSQAMVGYMYSAGLGVARDDTAALEWYKRAAVQGDVRAEWKLGQFYTSGTGGVKDPKLAMEWMRKTAEEKYPPAVASMGFYFEDANPPDVIEALRWLTSKKPKSEEEAYWMLGRFYQEMSFANLDYFEALEWRAMQQNRPYEPTGVERVQWAKWLDFRPASRGAVVINEVERTIRHYRHAADTGFVPAQVDLAALLWEMDTPGWNCGESYRYVKAAADKGDLSAQKNLAHLLFQGPDREAVLIGMQFKQVPGGIEVVDVSKESAAADAGLKVGDLILTYKERAEHLVPLSDAEISERNNSQDGKPKGISRSATKIVTTDISTEQGGAQRFVGYVQLHQGKAISLGVKRKGKKDVIAISVIPRKIEVKCPGAEEIGLKQDKVEAVKWFKKAADQGDPEALYWLAKSYREGTGVAQDYAEAMRLYKIGAANGDWESAQDIAGMYASGQGVPADKETSDSWFSKAVRLKHESLRH